MQGWRSFRFQIRPRNRPKTKRASPSSTPHNISYHIIFARRSQSKLTNKARHPLYKLRDLCRIHIHTPTGCETRIFRHCTTASITTIPLPTGHSVHSVVWCNGHNTPPTPRPNPTNIFGEQSKENIPSRLLSRLIPPPWEYVVSIVISIVVAMSKVHTCTESLVLHPPAVKNQLKTHVNTRKYASKE